jgi:hypothetical protein
MTKAAAGSNGLLLTANSFPVCRQLFDLGPAPFSAAAAVTDT